MKQMKNEQQSATITVEQSQILLFIQVFDKCYYFDLFKYGKMIIP